MKSKILLYVLALIGIISMLGGCMSAEDLVNKALKKDPEVLKRRMTAEIIYVTDTVPIYIDGEIIKVPVNVPVETTVIKWVKERTNKEERIDARLEKAELIRYKIVTDSLALNNKRIKAEVKLLGQENKLLKEKVKAAKKENNSDTFNWIKENWLFILLAIVFVLFLPTIISLIRKSSI